MTPITAEAALRIARERLATLPATPDACRAMLRQVDEIRRLLLARLDAHEAAHRARWREGRVR